MHETFTYQTHGKGTYDLTAQVEAVVERLTSQHAVRSGQVCVFLKHTSCSLLLMENGDPRSRQDLEAFFERLVPEDTPYFTHTDEGPDDMPSHIKMALTNPSTTIPVIDGQLMLGTWQSLYLYEHRRASHLRRVIVSLVGA